MIILRRILIIEDDEELRSGLKTLLERNGYEADYLTDFSNACEDMLAFNPDMVLLDITLPEIDGASLLKAFRKESEVPVIMVTSRNTEMDEVLCMSFGADDYVTKPYNPSILLLHIEAVFKRLGKGETDKILSHGELTIDLARSEMKTRNMALELTKNELGIISYMMTNRGKIVSREELISYLWDSQEFVDDNTLTVNINRVRKKLEELGFDNLIKTKRGQGYILE